MNLKQLKNYKAVLKAKWLFKNFDKIEGTIAMVQEYYNTQSKTLRKPKTELEIKLCANMRELGYEVN